MQLYYCFSNDPYLNYKNIICSQGNIGVQNLVCGHKIYCRHCRIYMIQYYAELTNDNGKHALKWHNVPDLNFFKRPCVYGLTFYFEPMAFSAKVITIDSFLICSKPSFEYVP